MKNQRIFSLLLFFSLTTSSSVFAQAGSSGSAESVAAKGAHCSVCEGAESQKWVKSAPGKLLRGFTNVGLGWMNLFSKTKESIVEGDNVLIGIGKGFGYTIARTVQGGLETLLFFFPPASDEPLRNCALGDAGWTGR